MQENTLIFSVIITVFNKEKQIKNTIKSVLEQTYTNFEIIIINDGSTDASENEILKLTDAKISYFKTANKGAAAARNFAIEMAKSEWLCFLDGDDLWKISHLEELKRLLDDFPNCGIYASRYQLEFKTNTFLEPKFLGLENDYRGIVSNYFEASMNHPIATSSSILIPKKVFNEIGPFKTYISSGQDTDMWLRIALHYPIAITNKVTATYLHYIENSLSKTDIGKKTILQFEDFEKDEKKNHFLKKYLDKYRKEYALHYKMANNKINSRKLYLQISKENLDLNYKIIYFTPNFILKNLLLIKRNLRKLGFDFTIYK